MRQNIRQARIRERGRKSAKQQIGKRIGPVGAEPIDNAADNI